MELHSTEHVMLVNFGYNADNSSVHVSCYSMCEREEMNDGIAKTFILIFIVTKFAWINKIIKKTTLFLWLNSKCIQIFKSM